MGRKLGQHFLRDAGVVERTLCAAELQSNERVVEIGPGEGVLTVPMLERVSRVVAFEVDEKLARELPREEALEVRCEDILKADLRPYAGWKVVANLPYYITTPILEKLLLEGDFCGLWLMMQKEVAERIVSPASKLAGALTYFVQYHADCRLLFTVPPQSFRPPPKVESAVIELLPKSPPDGSRQQAFERIVRTAFRSRRKTLRNSLKGLHPEVEKVLSAAGIDPSRRPETLSMEEFFSLEGSFREWS